MTEETVGPWDPQKRASTNLATLLPMLTSFQRYKFDKEFSQKKSPLDVFIKDSFPNRMGSHRKLGWDRCWGGIPATRGKLKIITGRDFLPTPYSRVWGRTQSYVVLSPRGSFNDQGWSIWDAQSTQLPPPISWAPFYNAALKPLLFANFSLWAQLISTVGSWNPDQCHAFRLCNQGQ